ncbi:PAS domain S-box protein [candidate division KSB1 bacterium]
MIDIASEKIEVLLGGKIPDKIEPTASKDECERKLAETVNKLIEYITEIHNYILPLSEGKLRDAQIQPKNYLGSPFQELHSRLLHLTWQAGQVAKGDYNQRVDFMGDFSEAFNSMIVALDRNERALRESEEKFRALFEISPFSTIISDLEGNIIYCNQQFVKMHATKYGPEEQVGRNVSEFFPEEELPLLRSNIKKTINEDKPLYSVEYTMLRKDGTKIPVEATSTLIRDNNGNPKAILAYAQDITERKKAEEELKEREKNISVILDSVHDIIFQLSLSGFIKYVNPKVKDLYGYNPQDLIGKHFKKTTPAYEMPKALNALKSVFSGKMIKAFEINQLDVNGNVIPMEIYLTPVKEKGKIVALQGVMRDLTERKKFESDLKQKDRQIKNIVEHSNEIFYVHDKNHNLTYISPQCEQIMGYTPEEMMVKWTELATDNQVNEIGFELTEKALKTGEKQSAYPLEIKRKDGIIAWIEIDESPLKNEDGIVIGMVGAARDITERKKAEEEKKLLEKQLLHSQKMESVGRLAGGVAHDFNNILSVIMGYADLLRLQFTDSTKNEGKAAGAIFRNTLRAKTLVSQLLGFSRRGKYNPEPVSINTLIKDSVNVSEIIFEMKIEVIYDFEENIHLCEVDKNQMDQVLTNLIINAKDAMPSGGRILFKTENVSLDKGFTKIIPQLNSGNYVKTSISDSGIGIPEEIKDNIFEPFFTTKGAGEGTGLGLATVYGIIKNHQGHIDACSKPGKGTTFTFYLPVSETGVIDNDEAAAIVKGDKTILVVDDEEDLREMLMAQLESLGYKVILACDGIEAVGIFEKQKDKIDLVLLDMIMPKMDGKDTFIALKKINPHVKVLLISGYSQDERVTGVLNDGVIDFIQKPLELTVLSKAINKALKK